MGCQQKKSEGSRPCLKVCFQVIFSIDTRSCLFCCSWLSWASWFSLFAIGLSFNVLIFLPGLVFYWFSDPTNLPVFHCSAEILLFLIALLLIVLIFLFWSLFPWLLYWSLLVLFIVIPLIALVFLLFLIILHSAKNPPKKGLRATKPFPVLWLRVVSTTSNY